MEVVDIVPTKALVVAWAVAAAIVLMKVLAGAWVEMGDIGPMKVLDMGDPMATGPMMSLVTEVMTIEVHLLMSTEAMMALATEEGATEGTMEATAMEEVRMIPAPCGFCCTVHDSGECHCPGYARQNMRSPVPSMHHSPHPLPFPPAPKALSLKDSSQGSWSWRWVRVAVTS